MVPPSPPLPSLFPHLEGQVDHVSSLEGSMCTRHGHNLCLAHHQVVNTVTPTAQQLKCTETLEGVVTEEGVWS